MNKPSFFIIGAPKCGTTALSKYLGDHESIFMSDPKEPHFFATDFQKRMRPILTLKHYLALFKNAKYDQLCGEASVWYLYSNEAIKNIAEFNPDAKIIIMLRNPVDMIHSLHSQKLYGRDEDIQDVEKAWNISWVREQGNHIPKNCREPKTLYYHKVAKYSTQLKNVYKYFPEEQVKIILFDDFKKDNLQAYKDTLAFLRVPDDGRKEFEKVNENKIENSKLLGDFLARPPRSLLNLAYIIKRRFGIGSLGVWRKLRRINTAHAKRKPLDKKTSSLIKNHYKKEITELCNLLNRDELRKW